MFVGKRKCSFNDNVFLSLYMHKLIAENILYDSMYCMGEMVKMRNDLTPSTYRSIYYRWFDQLTNTTFSVADTLEFPSHTSMTIGLNINDNCSDIIRLYAKIYVSPMVLDSNILLRKSACEPLQTEFIYPKTQRHFEIRLPFYWLWSLDGVLIDSTLSEDGQTHDNRAYTFDSAGNYIVNVKMKLGNGKYCHSYTDTANVFKRAKAEFSFFPAISDISDTAVQFVNQSSFAHSYQWQVSDGGIYSTKSPFHRFREVGNYAIQLIAKTNQMCDDTITKDFTIFDSYKIFAPSGFTPNGNGLNELWGPQITSAKSIDLKIYNRWGELLLHKTELPCTWDGSYKNEPCQEGIYVYLLTAKSIKGRWYYYKGTIELLR
jgi:gliding motility-associated-like protein